MMMSRDQCYPYILSTSLLNLVAYVLRRGSHVQRGCSMAIYIPARIKPDAFHLQMQLRRKTT